MSEGHQVDKARFEQLEARLHRFESEHAVRQCMQRYMAICDELNASSPLDELVGLFTVDAIWEGLGEKYAKTFGRLQGQDAIRSMFAKYTVEPAHFAMNAHFLTGELIDVTQVESATGRWMMLQASTYSSGASHLGAAQLTVDFVQQQGGWKIAHFRTRSLFGRPVSSWTSDSLMPAPRDA